MAQTSHFVLWMPLPEAVRDRFARLIQDLARTYGTPIFEPHLTMLGGLEGEEMEILIQTARLARALKPFALKLTHADYLAEHFRSLFVRAEPSPDLLHARRLAEQAFNKTAADAFMPHLSLMYGDISENRKEAIIKDIGREFKVECTIDRLELYRIDGVHPDEWRRVKTFAFGEKQRRPLKA
jgi:2'-5' RNA ligase